MKKVLILTALILMVSASAVMGLDLYAGLKAGAGVGFLTGSDWQNALDSAGASNSVRLGLTGSAFLGLNLGNVLAIEPGVTYTMTGGAYNVGSVDGTITANALTVPVYLRPAFAVGSGQLYLFAGPVLYVLLGDFTQKESGGSTAVTFTVAPDNRTLFGVSGGIGYSIPLGAGRFLVEAKYSRPLTEMFTSNNTTLNSAFLQLGYAFPLFVTY